jgi:hypothetical protein
MSYELESGQNVNPSQETKLTPEERFQQKIDKYFEGHDLQSPQVQAYCDFTDMQNVGIRQPWGEATYYNQDMITETIRQRVNGVTGYKREIEQVSDLAGNYKKELEDRYTGREADTKYSQGLMDIKNKAIDRITQQSQTPPQK